MSKKDQKLQFILFLDPLEGKFYSFCAAKGLIAKEEKVPHTIMEKAKRQIQELKICLEFDIDEGEQPEKLTSFQRRPIPLSLLSQRKFKYPVYFTEQYLPASALESFKVNDGGQLMKDNLNDFIKANIHLGELQLQLQKSKKSHDPPDHVTIDIKLIASVNEVIRTINRVILQDFGVVITMHNSTNKLIFKIRDKNEYMYGNESIANFQFIRQSLNDHRPIQLQIHQVSVYDKQQLMKFVFYRSVEDVQKSDYPGFPWQELIRRNPEELQFLIWYVPEDHHTHPSTFVQIEKLYSIDELVRANEKIKLKIQEKQRLQVKKIPRFLWKQKSAEFLEKRREEISNRFIELEGNIIYSGECFFPLEIQIVSVNNIYYLFHKEQQKQRTYENRAVRKKFLKFQSKEMFSESSIQSRFPSLATRYMTYLAMRKQNMIDIIPYMLNVSIQFVIGNCILHTVQSKYVVADNHQLLNDRIHWNIIAKLPMETTAVFKLQIHSKQGQTLTCGVGGLKLFDEYGFLRQGEQEVHLYAKQKIELLKIGCIDKFYSNHPNIAKITIMMPRFKNNVIWTLTDLACAKMLGYHPQLQATAAKEDLNLQRLNELLRFDPLEIRKYKDKDKELLRKCKKYYKHQSDKLINYLFAIDWSDPTQVAEVYATLPDWAPLKPTEALFILNPAIPDQKVRYYAVKRIQNFMDYEFVLYSNQITQALVSFQSDNNALIDLLLQKCVQEPFSMAVEYFWQFKNRVYQEFTQKRFRLYLQSLCMVTSFRKELAKQVAMNNYLIQMNESLVKSTESMKEYKQKNRQFIKILPSVEKKMNQICSEGFLFPIRPQYIFKALKQDECKMYDSKKLPFAFSCVPYKNYPGNSYKVMFKYGDDLKQDNLILQMFRVFDKLWRESGLDLKMSIYRTLSTGFEVGFIELIDAENNSKIHKDYGKGMVEAFDEKATLLFLQQMNPDKKDLSLAKDNYLKSSAAYLVATYILGIGDRHSGNVMVQKNGKFLHIDFGHILGNFKTKFNIKRERSPVLFTSQFLYVMGGPESKDYSTFQKICSDAYNILRKNAFLIVNLLAMMVSAEIPQLKSFENIQYVTEKLALDLSDAQAGERLINTIKEALLSQKSRNLDNAFHEAIHEG